MALDEAAACVWSASRMCHRTGSIRDAFTVEAQDAPALVEVTDGPDVVSDAAVRQPPCGFTVATMPHMNLHPGDRSQAATYHELLALHRFHARPYSRLRFPRRIARMTAPIRF